jgi:trimeric autotransporter adhesin
MQTFAAKLAQDTPVAQGWNARGWAFAFTLLAMAVLWLALVGKAFAAPPPVDTSIGNQARATYNDATGASQAPVDSNQVFTYVLPVGSYTLAPTRSVIGAPGTTVYLQHTVTNTGNVPLAFNLTQTNYGINGDPATSAANAQNYNDAIAGSPNNPNNFNPTTTTFFADQAPTDGSPDGGAITSTPSIPAGGTYTFIVAVQIPNSAVDGDIDELGVTVTPTVASNTFTGTNIGIVAVPVTRGGAVFATASTTSHTVEDRIAISGNAVITVTKALSPDSPPSGPSGGGTTPNPSNIPGIGPVASPAAPATGQLRYILTYTNTGANTATAVTITDTIGTGATAGLCYVPGSGYWGPGGGATPNLTDAALGDPAGITYLVLNATNCSATQTITAVIASVPPNTTAIVAFNVSVEADAVVGTSSTTNVASWAYDPDGAGPGGGTAPQTTGPAVHTVTPTASVGANNSLTTSANNGGAPAAPITPGTGGDIVPPSTSTGGAITQNNTATPSIPQGSVITFRNVIWNRGNGPDTFDITVAAGPNPFPAGTTTRLLDRTGTTPLQNNGGSAAVDTGSVPAPGASCVAPFISIVGACGYEVVLEVTLPAGYSDPGAATHNFVKTATSSVNPAVSDTVTDQIGQITAATVDLANGDASTPFNPFPAACTTGAITPLPAGTTAATVQAGNNCGIGASSTVGAGAPVITTYNMNPGNTARYKLFVSNSSAISDSYQLEYSAGGSALAAFTANATPSGWTVQFFEDGGAGDCTTTSGGAVSNTTLLNPNTSKLYCAQVVLPATGAGVDAGTYDVYFRARSTTTGAVDLKRDQLVINPVRALTLTMDQNGSVYAGGTVTYTHTLTNNGNVTEGETGANSTVTLALSTPSAGWSTSLYIDTNNDGVFSAGDALLTNDFDTRTAGTPGSGLGNGITGLSAGESVRLFVRVQAPLGAMPPTTETTILSVNVTNDPGGYASPVPTVTPNTDVTRVIAGNLRVDKTQALDNNCDGTADTAFTSGVQNQRPGGCIMYRIVTTNQGAGAATCVVLSDNIPAGNVTRGPITGVMAGNPSHQGRVTVSPHAGMPASVGVGFTGSSGVTSGVTSPAAAATGQVQTSCTSAATCNAGVVTPDPVCPGGNGFSLGSMQSITVEFGVQINQ